MKQVSKNKLFNLSFPESTVFLSPLQSSSAIFWRFPSYVEKYEWMLNWWHNYTLIVRRIVRTVSQFFVKPTMGIFLKSALFALPTKKRDRWCFIYSPEQVQTVRFLALSDLGKTSHPSYKRNPRFISSKHTLEILTSSLSCDADSSSPLSRTSLLSSAVFFLLIDLKQIKSNIGFWQEGKTRVPGEKPFGAE